MKVVEKFISINGEGRRAGELAVFIRFKGCNLNCSYCDTKWANEPACDYEELSPDKICEYVSETGIKNVTLTGGEPLLQKDIRTARPRQGWASSSMCSTASRVVRKRTTPPFRLTTRTRNSTRPIPIIMPCAGPIRQGCSGKMIPMPNTMTRWTIRRRAY